MFFPEHSFPSLDLESNPIRGTPKILRTKIFHTLGCTMNNSDLVEILPPFMESLDISIPEPEGIVEGAGMNLIRACCAIDTPEDEEIVFFNLFAGLTVEGPEEIEII